MSPLRRLTARLDAARLAAACVLVSLSIVTPSLPAQTVSADGDPSTGEVRLPCADGWNAFLVWETEAPRRPGVWTVENLQVRPELGCPEIVAMDDVGRCTILVSYSGKWTPHHTVSDGVWLGPVRLGDLDPRIPGDELYVGGKSGSLHRIRPEEEGTFDVVEAAHWGNEEVHTLEFGDLWPEREGNELLVFLRSGRVHLVVPGAAGDEGYETRSCGELPGRVRDALVSRRDEAGRVRILTVSRAREVAEVWLEPDGSLHREVVLEEPMGFGRVTRGHGIHAEVFYVTRDDGLVLRIERGAAGGWSREVVYAGPQGLRGVVAGRFGADPDQECVAVFGYSAKVQLLTRAADGSWDAETLFVDRARGHWLARAEVDGRNATDELVASGYGGRVVLFARPPGYGLPGVTTDPDAEAGLGSAGGAERDRRPLRLAVPTSGERVARRLSPLGYRGGFETKTLIYETLVRRDATGRIVPALAASWTVADDKTRFTFELRQGATFHDGAPVTAADVVEHFRRFVGLPEHDWLPSNRWIRAVRAEGDARVVVELERPCALLPDLCAINPCAIQAPGSRDREGAYVAPVGSGPWAFDGLERREGGDAVMRLSRHAAPGGTGAETAAGRLELLLLGRETGPGSDSERVLDAVADGTADAAVGSWITRLDPARVAELAGSTQLRVVDGPGSSVRYLSFSLRGRTESRALRARIASVLDRRRLARDAFAGYADPTRRWAAPSVTLWPAGGVAERRDQESAAAEATAVVAERPLVLLGAGDDRLARAVVSQLVAMGIPCILEDAGPDMDRRIARGAYDLRLERTWGVPYDPYLSLVARFLPREGARGTAAEDRAFAVPEPLRALVDEATRTPTQQARIPIYRRIQSALDAEVWIVPLLTPRRLAVLREDVAGDPRLDHDLYRIDPTDLVEARERSTRSPAGR